MAVINVLDKQTVDKIAAGEVIEGPSGVVKELVENAIDAGASQIVAEIKDGGTSLIRITDNGSGISEDDVKNAFKAHATSKIHDAADLISVRSLGFRGEALSSIAAVAKVEMLSKTAEAVSGTRYVINGGEEQEFSSAGCPEGTTFIVKDLFYNTPARKKFLKTPATEGRYIEEVMEHMAVSHPEIAFRFITNGTTKLQTPGNGKLRDVIFYMYGKNTADSLIALSDPDREPELTAGIGIRGFIGKPELTRGNREYENYFVNGRFVKDKVITRAVEDAFKAFLMQHRYPFTCLLISMDSSLVDVNVHPRKLEVRFADQEDIYKRVYNAVDYALHHRELIPDAGKVSGNNIKSRPAGKDDFKIPDIPMPEPFERKQTSEWKKEIRPLFTSETVADSIHYGDSEQLNESIRSTQPVEPAKPEQIPEKPVQIGFKEGILSEQALPEINIVGQIFDTYWILTYGDKVYLADQHACHEKVMYERFVSELHEKSITSQNLMPPVIVSLSPLQKEVIEKISAYLTSIGFEIESFGGNEYAIKAVPTELYGLSTNEMLFDILDQYAEEGRNATPDTVLSKIATMACKAAVKGNTKISSAEMKELLKKMMELENPYNCPHGRPTMIAVTKDDLEKKFKRQI